MTSEEKGFVRWTPGSIRVIPTLPRHSNLRVLRRGRGDEHSVMPGLIRQPRGYGEETYVSLESLRSFEGLRSLDPGYFL